MGKGDFLGEFEHLVLLAIVRLGNKGYGMAVRRELEQNTGRGVTIGAVYATLDRLEKKGFLASWRTDPEPRRGGRTRRHFRIQDSGRAALTQSRALIDSMWQGVDLTNAMKGR